MLFKLAEAWLCLMAIAFVVTIVGGMGLVWYAIFLEIGWPAIAIAAVLVLTAVSVVICASHDAHD